MEALDKSSARPRCSRTRLGSRAGCRAMPLQGHLCLLPRAGPRTVGSGPFWQGFKTASPRTLITPQGRRCRGRRGRRSTGGGPMRPLPEGRGALLVLGSEDRPGLLTRGPQPGPCCDASAATRKPARTLHGTARPGAAPPPPFAWSCGAQWGLGRDRESRPSSC